MLVRVIEVSRTAAIEDDLLFRILEGDSDAVTELPRDSEITRAEVSSKEEIYELFRCLELEEFAYPWTCPVIDNLYLEFCPAGERMMVSESIIRWEGKWSGDGRLKEPERLARWLVEHLRESG